MYFSSVTPWVFVATWFGYLLFVANLLPWWAPAITGWVAFILVWKGLNKNAKVQAIALSLVGTVALIYAYAHDVEILWRDLIAANIPLLAMFVAISFLALAAEEGEVKVLPRGKRSMLTTAVGIHLLGAIINLSIVFIFGDRMQKQGRLSSLQQVIIGRCFCAAAWWSPFFIATGVALTYSPEMDWKKTVFPGLLMAAIAVCFTVLDVRRRNDVSDFEGYPIRYESLLLPVVLAFLVITSHELFPDISVLVLICVLGPVGALLFMRSKPRAKAIKTFVDTKIINIGSQFALFLAAGVFSTGLKSVLLIYPSVVDLSGFVLDGWLYVCLSGLMIFVGLIGIHPLVSISTVSPLLLSIDPDPNQLAFLFLTTWAVSTASSPLSGFGLTLVSRYQANSMGIITHNWYYAILMWLLSSAVALLIF